MSLVDYASSDDESDGDQQIGPNLLHASSVDQHGQSTAAAALEVTARISGSNAESHRDCPLPTLRLPDPSELLGSLDPGPSSSNNIENRIPGSKKRLGSNGSAHLAPFAKLPHGNRPPSRIRPDTAGGQLLPPQLGARKNVATEDLGKLFVRRQKE